MKCDVRENVKRIHLYLSALSAVPFNIYVSLVIVFKHIEYIILKYDAFHICGNGVSVVTVLKCENFENLDGEIRFNLRWFTGGGGYYPFSIR